MARCDVEDEILLGDYVLIVAHVVAGGVDDVQAPLVYTGRPFGTHSGWLDRLPSHPTPLTYEPLDR